MLIYDFDGTLTPYSMPQYDILVKAGYDEEKFMSLVKKNVLLTNKSLYEVYYDTYRDILSKSNINFNRSNVCLGAKEVVFNEGVLEYFSFLQKNNSYLKHYVVTCGIKDYVEETKIFPYLEGVYGTTFNEKNGLFENLDFLMSDDNKVLAIKEILRKNKEDKVIYFGDGLTDEKAFSFVKSIGGITVFVSKDKNVDDNLKKLQAKKIIDYSFDRDFGNGKELFEFVKTLRWMKKMTL